MMKHLSSREPSRWAYCLWRCDQHSKLISSIATDLFGPPNPYPHRRVVVTGIGLVTPLGVGKRRVWERLIAGDTAIRALVPDDLPEMHRHVFDQLPSRVIGCVPRTELHQVPWACKEGPRRTPPFVHYALTAAAEALHDAQFASSPKFLPLQSTGVALGAGMSCTADFTEAGVLLTQNKLRRLSPFFVPRILVNTAAGAVSMAHGLRGPNHAVSTACATGAHCIGDAFRMVQRGDADVMVAGGTESCIDAIALAGFARIKALSTRYNDTPHEASRPFDRDRDGFVMGEGAGVLVLEELGHAEKRGTRIYGEIRGYGMSGDAFHVTQPPEDGHGAQMAMRRALEVAGVSPRDVVYVNAHATSTPIGDDVEQRAIASVFGLETTRSNSGKLAVSSTKGAIGHLLGAAGAVEAAFTVLALHHQRAPPTVNLENPEPGTLPKGVLVAEKAGRRIGAGAVMTNSFGFGGTNASLVFGPSPL